MNERCKAIIILYQKAYIGQVSVQGAFEFVQNLVHAYL